MFFARNRRRPSPRRSLCGRNPRLRLEQLEDRTLLSTATLEPTVAGRSVSGAEAGIRVVDVIPRSQSGETGQNSEPSIAVNLNDPNQAAISVFSDNPLSPFYSTEDGGKTWIQFDQKQTFDSTLSWSASGTLYLGRTSDYKFDKSGNITQATQEVDKSTNPVTSGTPFIPIPGSVYTTPPGAPIPDQPRVAAALVGDKDHIYLGYNNFTPFNDPTPPTGNTATVQFSTNSGKTWHNVIIDQGNATGVFDGAAVQPAVIGNHVYVAFQRVMSVDPTSGIAQGQIVVVRDDNAGNGGFKALGASGTIVASGNAPFTSPFTGVQSLGNERIGSDLTLAVDPRNPYHLYVGYADNPSTGRIQVHVQESTDGGQTWAEKFATEATPNFKSALPYLAVADNGAVGLLYTAQDIDNKGASFLETHFVQTGNDFATLPIDTLLSRFTDGDPPFNGVDPYIGDYEGLKAVGDTFYGTFSASNQADGTHAIFPGGVAFQRSFTGTLGTSTFQLTDGSDDHDHVDFSIDPYYFQVEASSGGRRADDLAAVVDGNGLV
jgi:hypothetical protein